jgi:hypothetical protein
MTSKPAIDPAISTLPVMNQLIANVSSVPNVRQLTALRTDLVCVSAPRNKTTRHNSLADSDGTYHAGGSARSPANCNGNTGWTGRANACILLEESSKPF